MSSEPPAHADDFSAKLGFPAPEPLVRLLRFVQLEAANSEDDWESWFESVTGLLAVGQEDRYGRTPPELFPFGNTGCDGIHLGYVIHDERIADDFPVGQMCPMDHEGVTSIGSDTRDAFLNIFSNQLIEITDDEPSEREIIRDRIRRASRVLDIEPDPSKAWPIDFGFELYDKTSFPSVDQSTPEGWVCLPTLDRLGVLAPEWTAHPAHCGQAGRVEAYHERVVLDECLKDSDKWLAAGYPASALVALRNALMFDPDPSLFDRLAKVYEQLDRPRHVQVVEFMSRRFG